MNHVYRLIFNRALGVMQVASELVRSPGGLASGSSAGAVTATLPRLRFALWCALGFVGLAMTPDASPVYAQQAPARIVADPTAPGNQRPTVLETNGVPVVNITTPSAAGVSRNTYSQFDVGSNGAIINNARGNAQTQLAGGIQGNPWLATGTAKVILNEVNSAHPSLLNGYVEVAGDRAQVVIANPAGIQISGGGFLNASRATLTTGTPVFNGGSLDHYRVEGGAIAIDGAGLDATQTDYTDLIAHSMELNGGIWAKQLQATFGRNIVSADHTQVSARPAPGGDTTAPAFALDAGALGGMYANKILLVGTEHGVGMRNAGQIGAQAGELVVTIDGRLENVGKLQSQGDARLTASNGIANAGTISASRELTVASSADLDNSSGTLNAARIEVDAQSLRNRGGSIEQTGLQALALQTGALSNRDGGRIGMAESAPNTGGDLGTDGDGGAGSGGSGGVDPGTGTGSGTLPLPVPLADGALRIAGMLDNDGGVINSGGGVSLSTLSGLDNSGGHLGLRQLTLAQGDLGNDGGELNVSGDAMLTVGRIGNDRGQFEVGGALQVDTRELSNRGGNLMQGGTAASTLRVSGTFDNTDGTFASNAASLTLDNDLLVNERGRIEHAGGNGLTLRTNALRGADGAIVTAGDANVAAGTVDHRGATLSATQVTLDATGFDNRGGTITAAGPDTNTLTVHGTFDNGDDGAIESNGDLRISAGALGNVGGSVQQAGTGTLAISATKLNGAGGTLASNGTLMLSGETSDLRGGTTFAQKITIDTGTLTTAGGTLTAAGTDALAIAARDRLDNTAGTIATNGALQLSAGALTNTDGTLNAAGTGASSLTVTNTFDNARGLLAGGGALTVNAAELINRDTRDSEDEVAYTPPAPKGVWASQVTVNAGRVDNANGQLGANALTVTADTLDNTDGATTAANALTIDAVTLNGGRGTLATNGTLALTGGHTNLRGGTTSARTITVETGDLITAGGTLTATGTDPLALTVRNTLDNSAGAIHTNGALTLSAGALTNTDGRITAAGTQASHFHVARTLDNTRGTLAAAGATGVHVGEFLNTGGLLQVASESGLTVSADGRLANDGGTIESNGAIELDVSSLTNAGGTVQTQQAITATVAGTLDNTFGTMVAGGELTVGAGTLLNRDTFDPAATDPSAQKGLFGGRITLDANAIDNARGQIHAADALTLRGHTRAAAALTNTGGAIDGTGAVTVAATSLDNAGGTLIQRGADGALALNVEGALSNTAAGLIGAEGHADVHAGSLDNSGGTLFATSRLTLASVGDVRNRDGGLLQSNGDLTVHAGGSLDNTDGAIDASGRGTVTASRIDNVRGQVLAGGIADGTALTVNASALNNQGGTVGSRDGDVAVTADIVDNGVGGKLVAQRDIALSTTTFGNAGGTVFATRHLRYENAAGTLDNAGGQFGAGDTAWIALARVGNTAGSRIQASTVWLTTPTLDIAGGEVAANTLHASLTTLSGLGRLYGAQWLDVALGGDFTYAAGQRLESDVLLDLAVAGTFTNQGTLQTAGELALGAANVINQGVINASNADGTGMARITVGGTLDNQRGASLEGDTVTLAARDVTNTGDVVGDAIGIEAETLTNGRDLGNQKAAVDYGEGFIGAAETLELRIAQRLSNLDGDIFSAGDLTIAGRAAGSRVGVVANVSGRIQAEGDATIAAGRLDNTRRMIGVETYTLTPDEQYALGSQRRFDEAFAALTDAERQRLQYLNGRTAGQLSAAEIAEKKALNHKVGWQSVDHVSDAMLAAINDWYTNVAAPEHGAYEGYVIDNAATPGDNPGAEVIQRDTYQTGERLIDGATSAAGQIVTGGNLTIDAGERVRNVASQIAAGHYLTIAGQNYTGTTEGSDARVENIAIVGQLTGERGTQAWIYPEIPTMYRDHRGWNQTVAELIGFMHEDLTAAGPVLASASVTAGQGLSIEAGDVTNTAVSVGGGLSDFHGGALTGPSSTGLGTSTEAKAAATGPVGGAQGNTVGGGSGPGSAAAQVVGTPERPLPGLVPADNGMFDLHADPNAPFLVTTAPRFAKGENTGSDYLLGRLDIATDLHKRLGDGYYEQRLVLEQILQLTGRRSLTGNGDGFEQYRVLMDHAADEAARLGFTLGAPLTSAQIAALDQDIVWLVEQEVNGQKVLVPVVYLSKATAERMKAEGALMAADTLDIQSTGTVRNDGTLDSARGTWLSADTLINDGAIRSGGRVDLSTRGDTINRGKLVGDTVVIDADGDVINTVRFDGLNTTGGVIEAGKGGLAISAGRDVIQQGTVTSAGHAVVTAGRDFVQNAATSSAAAGTVKAPAGSIASTGSTVVNTGRDAVLDQSKIDAGQHAVIDAGRDARFIASDITADGSIAVTAGRDIVSETVTDSATIITQESKREGKKRTTITTTVTEETVTGSTFKAGGDIAMVADRDIDLTAATVHSDAGDIDLSAERDVNLRAAYETDSTVQDSVSKKKNTLSRTTTTTHYEASDTTALGTTLSGDRVSVAAGRDITAQAAAVVATHDVAMAAGRNLTLTTAEETHTESYSTSTKKSGVFGAGAGFTVGQQKVQQGYELTETTHKGTVVGALGGSVSLSAGNAVHITGSDVLSETGTAIIGKSVTIHAAVDTTELTQSYKQSSAGVHVGLKGGAVSALEAAYAKGKAADEVEDDRLKALHAAQAGMAAKNAYDGAKALANGASAKDAGISLRIGIGASSASAQTTTTTESAKGSYIQSNGGVSIAATDGDLNVVGSQVDGRTVALAATGDINLRSQEEQHTTASRNKSGSAEVGVSIGSTTGFYVSADAGRGKASGNGTTHAETLIRGRDGVSFVSGGNTTLEGAQLIGDRIVGQVGGDFNVITQQDTDDYSSKQQQAGGEFVWGAGGSAYYGQQTADSHYRSAQEQSGVQAGSGGFQIDVAGNTHLKGGALASTADPDQNAFSTGSLTVEHLQNEASAEAEGASYGADSSMFDGSKYAAAKGIAGNLIGGGDGSDQRGSTTYADIADATVVIKNGDASALNELSRTANALEGNGVKPLDLQEMEEQVAWEQGVKGEIYTQAIKFTDEAYRTMFLEEAKVYVVEKDSEGNLLAPHELTQEEKFNLKPSADGKIHIADNGINNDLEGANKYADQHTTADGPQYFIHFPKAENGLSELFIAVYQKYLESDALGLANATDLTREYMLLYGQEGLHLDGHSRGSLTVGNAMESLENLPSSNGLLSDTTVGFFGPAYNAAAADALLSHLQNRKDWVNPQDGVLTLQNHTNDIVGGWIGLNPSTGGVTPENGNAAWEMARVLGGKNTPHNCYASIDPDCAKLWSGSPNNQSAPVPINQVPMSRAEEILYRLEFLRGSSK